MLNPYRKAPQVEEALEKNIGREGGIVYVLGTNILMKCIMGAVKFIDIDVLELPSFHF